MQNCIIASLRTPVKQPNFSSKIQLGQSLRLTQLLVVFDQNGRVGMRL